jgi:hypothetical protein
MALLEQMVLFSLLGAALTRLIARSHRHNRLRRIVALSRRSGESLKRFVKSIKTLSASDLLAVTEASDATPLGEFSVK